VTTKLSHVMTSVQQPPKKALYFKLCNGMQTEILITSRKTSHFFYAGKDSYIITAISVLPRINIINCTSIVSTCVCAEGR
jgi:hypothetical protein